MTWLRWDTETPESDVVGHLAEALGVSLAAALGHYLACCLRFGAHRPDGRASEVSDITIEQWGMWSGKRGRFAHIFRERCVGSDGVIRGWWRQEKLLEHQAKKRAHRKQAAPQPEKPAASRQETGAGSSEKSAYNETKTKRNVVSSSSSSSAAVENLGLTDEGRTALDGFLRASQNPDALLAECLAIVQGMRAPVPSGPTHLSHALHDLSVAGVIRPTAAQLRGFVTKAAAPAAPPRERSRGRARIEGDAPNPRFTERYRDPYKDRAPEPLSVGISSLMPSLAPAPAKTEAA